jgi:hypothetical protein
MSPEELYGNEFGQKAYYKVGTMEVIDVIETFAPNNVPRSHALKYLLRAGRKGETRGDLEKALWWIRREMAALPTIVDEAVQNAPPFPNPDPGQEPLTEEDMKMAKEYQERVLPRMTCKHGWRHCQECSFGRYGAAVE